MYNSLRSQLVWGVVGCVLVGVSGCSLGAKTLHSNRSEYNRAIHRTEKEELLLNIVRLRYSEPIKFLQVSSVVSSFNYGAGINADATIPFGVPKEIRGPNVVNVGGGVNYNETPTVTYVPLEGQQFARQILQGPSIETLIVLLRSGWTIGRVMPILVERLGALSNVPGAGPVDRFVQLIKLWENIQARGDLHFVLAPHADEILVEGLPVNAVNLGILVAADGADLQFQSRDNGTFQLVRTGASLVMELRYANEEEAAQVAALLGRASTRPKGTLVERIALRDPIAPPVLYRDPVTSVTILLRSFADQLFYISQGISVPPDDRGVALSTAPTAPKLLDVRHSRSRPGKAYVAIHHRHHWFAIADADVHSKENFSLLLTIFSLNTTGAGAAPALTLPVGR